MALFTKRRKTPDCTAIIAAAGSGTRFGGDKLFCEVAKKPVLAYTLEAFERATSITSIIVVTRAERVADVQTMSKDHGISKITEILAGGESRADSVLRGVMAARKASFVAIHDGARPLVSPALIDALTGRAARSLAAIPVVEVADTIKTVEGGFVTATPDRAALRRVQTPQVFETNLIKGALYDAIQKGIAVTDDSAAAEAIGVRVAAVEGEASNIKITTAEDLLLFEALITRGVL